MRKIYFVGLIVSLFSLYLFTCFSTAAQNVVVEVEAGQPSIWSLGQAHYLLANMHHKNRSLNIELPTPGQLDPNKINASKVVVLQQLLEVQAAFDQKLGIENQAAVQNYRESLMRREEAKAKVALLEKRQVELRQQQQEIKLSLARLITIDAQRAAERSATTPPAALTEEDKQRAIQIAELKAKETSLTTEQATLEAELTKQNGVAGSAITAPSVNLPTLESNGSLPTSNGLTKFYQDALTQMVAENASPSLHSSIILDNFIQMQYEIIAKQLTLLRDEVGPDERILFLELPASIYTVADKGDDYVAQAAWEVTGYYDEVQTDKSSTPFLADDDDNNNGNNEDPEAKKQEGEKSKSEEDEFKLKQAQLKKAQRKERLTKQCIGQPCPITLEMITKKITDNKITDELIPPKLPQGVRALDVIPRQSALNINEHHATIKKSAFQFVARWVFGFGAKVNYQRQRELYERFMQQEVFAAGFGKGTNRFGWTFGPTPGTRRIAPGQRTMFAVLAVPHKTLALKLKATGRAFKRNQSPDQAPSHLIKEKEYIVAVPSEKTTSFWIRNIMYVSVKKGEDITAIIQGRNFSPQLGILINGVPLQKSLTIAQPDVAPSGTTSTATSPVIKGAFEITNSRQIILRFSMGSAYTGTPIITFVTPERSSAINFFNLAVNGRWDLAKLSELSVMEPMFKENFTLNDTLKFLSPVNTNGYRLTRLTGTGLLPNAEVWVNSVRFEYQYFVGSLRDREEKLQDEIKENPDVPFVTQDATNAYLLYFKPESNMNLRYRQMNRQGYEEIELTLK
jgi:hypothetical protein